MDNRAELLQKKLDQIKAMPESKFNRELAKELTKKLDLIQNEKPLSK